MWAIGIMNIGGVPYIRCGMDNMTKLHYKNCKYWNEETRYIQAKNDEVYVIRDFTQEMCEMSNAKLVETVRRKAIYRIK